MRLFRVILAFVLVVAGVTALSLAGSWAEAPGMMPARDKSAAAAMVAATLCAGYLLLTHRPALVLRTAARRARDSRGDRGRLRWEGGSPEPIVAALGVLIERHWKQKPRERPKPSLSFGGPGDDAGHPLYDPAIDPLH